MSAIVFTDTETTGLLLDDDIWEFDAIRRETSGAESHLHLFIEHDEAKCAKLPEPFRSDHMARFPTHSRDLADMRAAGVALRPQAARVIAGQFFDRPHLAGAVPDFDAYRLDRLLTAHNCPQRWHYHLIDVENLAVGFLAGIARMGGAAVDKSSSWLTGPPTPPWKSDDLSRALGIDPDRYSRHTATGDVLWAKDIYDLIMGGNQPEGLPL